MKSFLLIPLLAAGSAAAQEANDVFLDATYLDAPTDWCPADEGVPLIVAVSGPNIVDLSEERPKRITVRRGSSREELHFGSKKFDETAPVIGRLFADFRTCQSPWQAIRWDGVWRVIARDGSELDSGAIEEFRNIAFYFTAVKSVYEGHKVHSSEIRYLDFGHRVFFTKGRPRKSFTQTFAADADKESSQ